LEEYGAEIELVRLALAQTDVEPGHLPSFAAETKRGDSRYAWFTHRYGTTCWELDALSPVDLRARVEAVIQQYINWEAWERCEIAEQAERQSLGQFLDNWRTCISGQATE
jgi:hypothetical protein